MSIGRKEVLIKTLSELGLTPASRTKLDGSAALAQRPEEPDNPFAVFD